MGLQAVVGLWVTVRKGRGPPGNSCEYKNKGITIFAFCNLLILEDMVLASESARAGGGAKKEKREQAPALQMQHR
jgi:hypothetical protein